MPKTGFLHLVGFFTAAAVYFLFAKFGLAFALPLGYASVIWPATSVALLLALRFRAHGSIGCGAGAFLALLSSGPGYVFEQPSLTDIVPMGVIGGAVALQAFTGQWLIQTFARRLPDDSHILKLLGTTWGISIPIASIRALVETLALHYGDHVPRSALATVGSAIFCSDLLAALAIYPITLLAGTTPLVRLRADRGFRAIVLVQAAVSIIGWTVAGSLHLADESQRSEDFVAQSTNLIRRIQHRTADDNLFLNALRSLNDASPELSRAEFADFSAIVLAAKPQINLIALVRRVRPEARTAFEQARTMEVGHPIAISQIENGALVPDPPRDTDYFPLDYVEPAFSGVAFEGFDLGSDEQRRAVLELSARADRPTVSPLLHRLSLDQPQHAVFTALPFHDHPGETTPDSIRGFVILRTDLDHWILPILETSGSMLRLASVALEDVTESEETNLARYGPPEERRGRVASDYDRSETFDMEGRRWRVEIGMSPAILTNLRDSDSLSREVLPQALAYLLSGLISMSARQRRARDRFEAQVGALSRQFLLNINGAAPPRAIPAPVSTAYVTPWVTQIAERCSEIWNHKRTEQHFQPIVHLRTGKLMGFESLLRIPSQPHAVTVCDYINWAEREGHIRSITQQSIEDALTRIERLQEDTGKKSVPWISVNVSASDLGDPDFVDGVVALARFHPDARTYLKLEITESVLLSNIERTAERLLLLRAAGLHIALDDFGTGYASLSYLRQLPIDSLKIDRSFITPLVIDPAAREIVHSLITLARKLSVDVIAEGIEDDVTALTLLKLGCTQGQGFRFAKACPFEVVAGWVREGRRFKSG